MSDIFQEIDEDLRRDRFAKLWARYGMHLIVLAVLVVIATAAVTGWRQYQFKQRQAEGVRFAAALDLVRDGKSPEAIDAFAALASTAGGGHAMLARFEEAALKARSGDAAGALALYDQLAADQGIDPAYRDMATLLASRAMLDKGDGAAAIDRLKPLTESASPWHPSALELTALAQLRAGDRAAARKIYQTLADDLQAPQGTRARAAQMLTTLGS